MSGHPEVAINVAENHTFVIKNLVTCILGVYDWQLKSFKVVSCRMIKVEHMSKLKKNNSEM